MEETPKFRSEEEYLISLHPSFEILAPKPSVVAAMLVILALVSLLAVSTAYKKYTEIEAIYRSIAPVEELVDTSSWKTYRNTQYGFEFRYPMDWKMVLSEDTLVELWSPETLRLSRNVGEGIPDISVSVEGNPAKLDFYEWYESYDPGTHLGLTSIFTLNNKTEGFLTKPAVDAGMGNCCEVIFVPSPQKMFFVKFLSDLFTDKNNLVPSTFTFLE